MTTENYNDNNDLDFIDKNDKESPTSEISSMTGITENITPIGLLALLTLVIYLAQKDNESNENKNLGNNNTDNKNLGNNNTDNKNLGNNNTDKKIAQKDNIGNLYDIINPLINHIKSSNDDSLLEKIINGIKQIKSGDKNSLLLMLNELINKNNAVKNDEVAKHIINNIKSSNNDRSDAVELQNQDLNKVSRNLTDYIQGKKEESYVKRMKAKQIQMKEGKKVTFADPIKENVNDQKNQNQVVVDEMFDKKVVDEMFDEMLDEVVKNLGTENKEEKGQIKENLSPNRANSVQEKKKGYVEKMKARQIQMKEGKKVTFAPHPIEENANKENNQNDDQVQDVNNGDNEEGSDNKNLSYNLYGKDYGKKMKKQRKEEKKKKMMGIIDVRDDNMR